MDKPPYKGQNGIWLTEAIFWERWSNKPTNERVTEKPVFSLYDSRPGLINARETFVSLRDPTGRKWALTYLGDWNHWLRLMKCPWFREAVETWLVELNAQLKSEAMSKIYEIMGGENGAQALQAAKYLAGEEYNKSARGRPSKQELDGAMKQAAKAMSQEDEDLQRIGLKVIPGGKGG